jgi:glycosyltransferase involved in cell wall biosynthesis
MSREQISIIYIHHEKALGGAPLSLLFLIRKLDRQKYNPHIICLREGPAAELFRKNEINVTIVPGPDLSHTELVWFRWWQFPRLFMRILKSFFLFFSLRIKLSEFNSQRILVHLNSSTLLVGALAAKSLKLPVIWHIREPLASGYFGIRKVLLRNFISLLSNHIIAISHNDADQLGKIPVNKLSVIYNFVDFNQFHEKIEKGLVRKELQIPSNAFVILFLGGSARVKGATVLLHAIPRILQNLSSAHIVIAGEVDSEFQLEVQETLGNKTDKIHLIGPRLDVPSLIADCNVLIFPSTVPHFARPIIEAAAMGKPVIASDLPGVQELVIRNETGVLIPPNESLSLSQSILELAADEPRSFRLGHQGLLMAREKFDAERNSTLTFAVYDKVLGGQSL